MWHRWLLVLVLSFAAIRVFWHFALFVLGVCILVVATTLILLGETYLLYAIDSSKDQETRMRQLLRRVKIVSASPCNQPTEIDAIELSASELASRIDRHTKDGVVFDYLFRGLHVRDGLPPESCESVILHVHGSWAGPFYWCQKLSKAVNRVVGGAWQNHAFESLLTRASLLQPGIPMVGFAFPTSTLSTLNFGQEDDKAILDHVYRTISPHFKRIYLYGEGLGALRILNWLGTKRDAGRLAGVILESPLLDPAALLPVVRPGIAKRLLSWVAPNYAPDTTTTVSSTTAADMPPMLVAVTPPRAHILAQLPRAPEMEAVVFEDPKREMGEHVRKFCVPSKKKDVDPMM
jgi:hypothetical protein